MRRRAKFRSSREDGAALIVALWVLLILALLISSFAFDMHIEAHITSYYRKRMKAQYLSRAGVEWAKLVLVKSNEVTEDEEGEDENLIVGAINLSRGVAVSQRRIPLGDGEIVVDIMPEQGRFNVNALDDLQWVELLDYANVPTEQHDELIDCFYDWVDEGDEHLINGAESDDPFYEERGYKVKNAKLDTISELLLIKGFTQEIVYGGPAETEDDPPLLGIARSLTTWGDGKINVNTASRDVLLTLPGIDEVTLEGILELRLGEDGEAGTRDDGFESAQAFLDIPGIGGEDGAALGQMITVDERRYVRVVSIGEVGGVRSGIWCVLLTAEDEVVPVYWREEHMP